MRRARLFVAVLATALIATGGLTARAKAPDVTGEHGSGFPIRTTGKASGGWMGAHRVDHTTLFITTPGKRPNRRGYRSPRSVEDLRGARGASPAETARAAWILSKYGAFRDDVQAAAVDASVYHLLAGKPWRITGSRGARRIRQGDEPVGVRRFARIMLRASRQSAGAYTASLGVSGADVGGTISAEVSVVDGRGSAVSGLPVTVTSGAVEVAAVSGADGRAVARFGAASSGWHNVTAYVTQVPDHRLHLRLSRKSGQASAAVAGLRRTLVVMASAPVRGAQSLALSAAPETMVVGDPARVTARIAGDGSARTAQAWLMGPFSTVSAATCSGVTVGTVTATVSADGDYLLPAIAPVAGGFYAWQVGVDGAATSLATSACGAQIKVRGRSSTTVVTDAAVSPVGELGATGGVTGLPFGDKVSVTGTLFGPYDSPQHAADDACATSADHAVRTRSGNGNVHFTVFVEQAGIYVWQAQTAAEEMWLGSRSSCLATGTLVTVH